MFIHRALTIAVILIVTAGSYAVYNSDLYFVITDEIGYFPYMALTPLASILLLYPIPGKLARNLMVLFGIMIGIDGMAWFLSGIGYDVIEIYLHTQTIAFVIELLLFVPHRILNGPVRAICRHDYRRVFAKVKRPAYNRSDNLSTDFKAL